MSAQQIAFREKCAHNKKRREKRYSNVVLVGVGAAKSVIPLTATMEEYAQPILASPAARDRDR